MIMGFCTKCGKQLNEGDRFCFHCGEPIPEVKKGVVQEEHKIEKEEPEIAVEPIETSADIRKVDIVGKEHSAEKVAEWTKVLNNKKVMVIIGVAVVILLLIIGCVLLSKGKDDVGSGDTTETIPNAPYLTYSNDNVCFSVEYPEGYQISEPNKNNVVITESNNADFQAVIEYAYHTPSNCAIYSSDDLASQIKANMSVLTDWVGVSDLNLISQQQTTVAGMKCYEYCFDFLMDNNQHTGKMYLFDGMGGCGCYSFMTVVNENVAEAGEYKALADKMLESFRVTGQCMPEGYRIYDSDDIGLQFMIRDEASAEIKEDASDGDVAIYPVDGIYTECSVWINKSSFGLNREMEDALKTSCNYYFKYKDDAKYLSEPILLQYGRYPCMGIDLQYYEDGVKNTASIFLLKVGDAYWKIAMETTDAYYDTAAMAVSDVLFSIMFDVQSVPEGGNTVNGTESSVEANVDTPVQETSTEQTKNQSSGKKYNSISDVPNIIAQIESTAGFREGTGEQGILADMNRDGVDDFLATYTVENSKGGFDVMYEVWTLPPSGPVKLKSGLVFTQIGGNSGFVDVVEKDNVRYLVVNYSEPAGDSVSQYITYFEWSKDKQEITGGGYYLEAHAQYEDMENGDFLWGATRIDYATYKQYQSDFSNSVFRLNILSDPSTNGAKAFKDMK